MIFIFLFFRVTTVYFNKLGLFHFLKRPHESITIRFARAPTKKAHKYDVPVYSLPGRPLDIDLEKEQTNEEDNYEDEDYESELEKQ